MNFEQNCFREIGRQPTEIRKQETRTDSNTTAI